MIYLECGIIFKENIMVAKTSIGIGVLMVGMGMAWLLPGFDQTNIPAWSVITHNVIIALSGLIAGEFWRE